MKSFRKDLREHAIKVSDYEKKEMTLLTDKEYKSMLKTKNKASQRSLSLNHKVQRSCSQYLKFKIQNIKRNPSSIS